MKLWLNKNNKTHLIIKKFKLRTFIFLVLIFARFNSSGQVCNFCTSEELKLYLKHDKLSFIEKDEKDLVKKIIVKNDFFTKTWSFKYDFCFRYDVSITRKRGMRRFKSTINRNFTKLNKNNWQDFDNTIELHKFGKVYNFKFYPKVSINNLNHKTP